jgi:hypothetical protein
MEDKRFRKQFLADPAAVLRAEKIDLDPDLIPKDMPVLRLMDDERFQQLAKAKDYAALQKYLIKEYPNVVTPEAGPAHVADAVEAVAVAIPAVAVADPVV